MYLLWTQLRVCSPCLEVRVQNSRHQERQPGSHECPQEAAPNRASEIRLNGAVIHGPFCTFGAALCLFEGIHQRGLLAVDTQLSRWLALLRQGPGPQTTTEIEAAISLTLGF